MEFGGYFGKVFGNMFQKNLYWPTLVVELIIGAIQAVFLFLFVSDIIKIVPEINNITSYTGLMALGNSFLIPFVVLIVIFMYLNFVIVAFVIGKIDALESGTQTEFFHRFKTSFLIAGRLFGAHIVLGVVVALILAIIYAISLIPIIGFVLAIILGILFALYLVVVDLTLIGSICIEEQFMKSISSAFSLPFRKLRLVLYSFILLIFFSFFLVFLLILGKIPFLGDILLFFLLPALTLYALTWAYFLTKDKLCK